MANENDTGMKYLRAHQHGFITDDPLNAHAELTLRGWENVSNDRAADPTPPEGATGLYAKGTRIAWLISEDPNATTWDEIQRFRDAFASMDEPQRRYLGALVNWLKNDDSGHVTERITKHQKGERVTTEYFDMATGERRHIPWNDPLPERCEPILGELEVSHG